MTGLKLLYLGMAICAGFWIGTTFATVGSCADNPASWTAEKAAAAATAAAAEKPAAATRSFKKTLGDAATAAFKDGQITRWQLARVRMAIAFRAEAMAEIQAAVIDQAIQDGVLRDAGPAAMDGFDWSTLLAFIKEWMPFIMQIIAMF
jgi:hypothetical protein